MDNNFLPFVSITEIEAAKLTGDSSILYDVFTAPLHEELYRRNSFDFLDELNPGQRLLLTFDYVQMQVGQGGFIQLIQNGYVGLLPELVIQFEALGCKEMSETMDKALQIYVLNSERLDTPTSVEEFAKLYNEFQEFAPLDEAFLIYNPIAVDLILKYALANLQEFVRTEGAS